mmetsp:Transcript_86378/g.157618  ORF Transcript_86378/g.157618 Transcript_86378/m.157618 type:complete len:84 (-) Transcript_86378:268-519(-)
MTNEVIDTTHLKWVVLETLQYVYQLNTRSSPQLEMHLPVLFEHLKPEPEGKWEHLVGSSITPAKPSSQGVEFDLSLLLCVFSL